MENNENEQNMTTSIFWYDFETTGISPRADRPLQVAGIRTDLELNEIAEPINLYCQLSEDVLPHPQACLVTGITPETMLKKGVNEATFFNVYIMSCLCHKLAQQVITVFVLMMR